MVQSADGFLSKFVAKFKIIKLLLHPSNNGILNSTLNKVCNNLQNLYIWMEKEKMPILQNIGGHLD